MKYFSQRNIIITLLIIVGLFILFSRTGCKDPVKPVLTNTKTESKKIDSIVSSTKQKVEIITLENGNIQKSIDQVKPVLKKSQVKTVEIKEVAKADTSKSVNTANDYFDLLAEQAQQSDSLCNYYISLQNDQILNYEKIVSLQASTIDSLEEIAKRQISEREKLESYTKKLEKSLRRKKLSNKLKTATILAGAIGVVSLILK